MTDSTRSEQSASPAIHIESLNSDKTRKTDGTGSTYTVYFQLSAAPATAWNRLFEKEWQSIASADAGHSSDAAIERAFLTVHCPLEEIETVYLPRLKTAVERTNTAYAQFLVRTGEEQQQKEDRWSDERSQVEAVAGSLHFDPSEPPKGEAPPSADATH